MSDHETLGVILGWLKTLHDGQEALRADQSKLADAVNRLRIDVMARVDRLQDQLTQQIEAGNVSIGLAASTSRDAKAARDSADLARDTLASLAQQVQRLNVRVAALENQPGRSE